MGDKQGQVRFTAFGQMNFVPYPRRAPLLAVVSLFVVGRADVARGWGNILEIYANELPHRSAGNFVPTPVARFLQQGPGGATGGPLDQKGHQAALFLAVRYLRQKPDARLPPKANANLRGVCHSG